MSDQQRRFTFNPPLNQNQNSENDVEQRDQSFSHPHPFGDSMEAVKKAQDVTDPKSQTDEFERNLSNQFASRGDDTTNQLVDKNENNSSNSIRRSPFGKLRQETKEEVKQLMGKPPSSGRESLGQASMLPTFQGANVSRISLVSNVKQVNLQSQNNQSQQPIQWAQTAKFNNPSLSMQNSDLKDVEDSEDKSAEPILTSAQKKQQELKQRFKTQQLSSPRDNGGSLDQNKKSENNNATLSSFNNLVSPQGHYAAVKPPEEAFVEPEQPSDVTMQKTNIVDQDQIIHEDATQINSSEVELKRNMANRSKEIQISSTSQSEIQVKNDRSKLSKSKVSWTKESSLPGEVVKSQKEEVNTPQPDDEHDQIVEQNPQFKNSNIKSLTNKSLVLSSNDNQEIQGSVNILKQQFEEEKLDQQDTTSPYKYVTEERLKVAIETMDPHFEGSKHSSQNSSNPSLTPMEDSENNQPIIIDDLNNYNTRLPNFNDPNMGIILAKSLDERQDSEVPMGKAVKTPEEIEEEKREYEEISKLGESMWLTDLYVNKPITVIVVGGGIILMMVAICLAFKLYWPSLVTVRDLLDYSDIHTQLFDARRAAFGEIQRRSSEDEKIPLQSILDTNWQLLIGIECVKEDCDNVLTPEGIMFLDEIDQTINNDTTWSKICLLDSPTNQTCMDRPEPGYFASKASPLAIFKMLFGEGLQEMTQFGIDFALFGLASELEYFELAIPLFGSEFTRNNRKTKLMRMALTFAGPIEVNDIRFNNIEDRQETQEFFIANWQANLNDKLLELQKQKYPGYAVHTFGRSYYYRQFYRQLIWDVLWSGLATVFCFCIVLIHTKSLFVTSSAMAMILYSFPITLVIYKLAMGISNLSSLHLLIVFVILGISCDNIFVVCDAWEQSDMYPQFTGSLHKRMAYTFRRASLAILATSSTTAFAFLSNGFSKLMPVSAFGYFAFVIVPVNYVLIVFYFPAFLIVYENHVKVKEQQVFQFFKKICFFTKIHKIGHTDSGDNLGGIEIIESNSVNFKNVERIPTRFEDESFITNQIFQTQRSRTSLKQAEYYDYMQQYYQIKQKEAQLAAIISSHKRKEEDNYNSSPIPKGKRLKMIKRNSQPSIQFSKNRSQPDLATIQSAQSLISRNSRGSKATVMDSKHLYPEINQNQEKRVQTGGSQNIIDEEEFENEELKEGGGEDLQEQNQNNINNNRNSKNKQSQLNSNKKKLRNTVIIEDSRNKQKQLMFELKEEHQIGGSVKEQYQYQNGRQQLVEQAESEDVCEMQVNTNEMEKPSSKSKNQKNITSSRSLVQGIDQNINKNSNDLQNTFRPEDQDQVEISAQPREYGALELFLDTKWNNFVREFRWVFIIVGFGVAVYAGVRSMEIQGLSQMEAFFGPSHYMQMSLDKHLNAFNQNELSAQTIRVDIMWGIAGINKEGVDFYNASDIGKVDWDQEFDITIGDNQKRVYDLCQYLKSRKDLLYMEKESSLSCWIDDFKNWLEQERQRFPVQEIVYRNQTENFYHQLNVFLNETKIGQDHITSQNIQFIGSKMVYMRLQMLTTSSPFWPYKIKKPIWEDWDSIVHRFNLNSGQGINKAHQTAGIDWCFAIMEIGLVKTMEDGLKISIGFALIALLIATANIIQAILASMTIGLIIINVMAIVAYKGWPLGSGESVGVVVCVGFAVDYVVHLASHYVHSKAKDRNGRIKESLRELGGSILSGSITTIGASCCLFLGVLTLFSKFGIFVISTIGFSMFYSLGFFAALCHVMGPVGQFGNVIYMFQTLKISFQQLFKFQSTKENEDGPTKNGQIQ